MLQGSVRTISSSGAVGVSVIIPHYFQSRSENLDGLVHDLRNQTLTELEIIIVEGVSPQGKAINQGVRLAKGRILVILDDDSRLGHRQVIENMVRVIESDAQIGIAGASIMTPDHANRFQKRAAAQFPRFNMPVVQEMADSDLPCHGCMAIRKTLFIEIGMEREDILRGLDPDLRVRVRRKGYRVVLVPSTWVYHPVPENLIQFIRTFIRNGYGSAYLQMFYPEINYDTDEGTEIKTFVPKRPFLYRLVRYPLRLLKSLAACQWIRVTGYLFYAGGYVWGAICFSFQRLFDIRKHREYRVGSNV